MKAAGHPCLGGGRRFHWNHDGYTRSTKSTLLYASAVSRRVLPRYTSAWVWAWYAPGDNERLALVCAVTIPEAVHVQPDTTVLVFPCIASSDVVIHLLYK